jgi:hypothetical protein
VQATVGRAVGVFAAVHLANRWLAPFRAEAEHGFQAAARAIDQHRAVEILRVALPLLRPAAAGLRRMRRRGRAGRSGGWRMHLHRVTSPFLLLVVCGCVAALRGRSLVHAFFPGVAGISVSLAWLPGSICVHCTRGFGVEVTR